MEYRVCPHCEKMLKFKKFQEHRRLFYDAASRTWTKEINSDASSSDIEFSDIEEDERD